MVSIDSAQSDPGSTTPEWLRDQSAWADFVNEGISAGNHTRHTLAKEIGLSREMLRNWLTLRSRVDARYITKLAIALEQDPMEHMEILGFIPPGYRHLDLEKLDRTMEEMSSKVNEVMRLWTALVTDYEQLRATHHG